MIMSMTESCNRNVDYSDRRRRFQQRKLQLMLAWRDSLERRLAGANASISTLMEQIDRDNAATS